MKSSLQIQTLKFITLFNKKELFENSLQLRNDIDVEFFGKKIENFNALLFIKKNILNKILNDQFCNAILNTTSMLSIGKDKNSTIFFSLNFTTKLPFNNNTCYNIRKYFKDNKLKVSEILFNSVSLSIDGVVYYLDTPKNTMFNLR